MLTMPDAVSHAKQNTCHISLFNLQFPVVTCLVHLRASVRTLALSLELGAAESAGEAL